MTELRWRFAGLLRLSARWSGSVEKPAVEQRVAMGSVRL